MDLIPAQVFLSSAVSRVKLRSSREKSFHVVDAVVFMISIIAWVASTDSQVDIVSALNAVTEALENATTQA